MSLVGRAADWSLFALIVLAPALGGSSSLLTLPVLWALASVAILGSFAAARPSDRTPSITPLAVGLAALSAFTLIQSVPLPTSWVALISPHSEELRRFLLDDADRMTLAYEVSAARRESAKLGIYAMVAVAALLRARRHHGVGFLARAVIASGFVTALIALLHRALGVERVLGVLPSRTPTTDMITTFANANHAASFMTLGAIVSLGAALTAARGLRAARIAYFGATLLFSGLVVLSGSRAGLIALSSGLFLFALLSPKARSEASHSAWFERFSRALVLGFACLVGVGAFLFRGEARVMGRLADDLGPGGKFAAFRDVPPVVADHPWVGIGRGSFVSVYPGYKTSPAQLTFAYPENIVAQLLAEWGLVLGGLALAGLLLVLVLALLQLRRRRSTMQTAVFAGLLVVVLHNLVDFSLELPGVAIPFVALLAGLGHSFRPRDVLALSSPVRRWGVGAGWVAASGVVLLSAFLSGDLDLDLARCAPSADGRSSVSRAEVEAIARRHPANGYLAARASYFAEISEPPDLAVALKWANRALLLAPTYADAHLAAGRLLVRMGHRSQGFVELRSAWRLASAARTASVIDHIIALSRNPAELRIAIPRQSVSTSTSTTNLDVPSPYPLSQLVKRLRKRPDRRAWIRPLFEDVRPEVLSASGRLLVATAALQSGCDEVAEAFLRSVLDTAPTNASARSLWARLLRDRGDVEGARHFLEAMDREQDSSVDHTSIHRTLLALALQEGDATAARRVLEVLRRDLGSSRKGQAETAGFDADVLLLEGDRPGAIRTLTSAIAIAPEDYSLRLRRADLLLRSGREHAARIDLLVVLETRPHNRRARTLLHSLNGAAAHTGGETIDDLLPSESMRGPN
ncbi:MAG: O-antigen ligase family protein [Deltaproteobacteria bacterium]|nr:O-antigen ligase family protein [Deltaproteobacteria bacterium]